jgi:hypothetical protein
VEACWAVSAIPRVNSKRTNKQNGHMNISDELRIFFLFPQMSDVILNNQSAEGKP